MNENVITIEECRKRSEQGSFEAIRKLEASAELQVVHEDEIKEVSPWNTGCKWNSQPPPAKSKRLAYILVCLPVVLSGIYILLTRGRRFW